MTTCVVHGNTVIDFLTGRELPDTGDEMVRQIVEKQLVEVKGFLPDEIEVDRCFPLELDGKSETGRADLVVHGEGRPLMVLRCAPGSVVSREREVLAAARLAYDRPVPLAVATNGRETQLVDVVSGQVLVDGLNAFPTRDQALALAKDIRPVPLTLRQRLLETRIYLAYADISCEKSCGR